MATDTAIEVVMPQMGVSVSEGTITKWLKQEGEEVAGRRAAARDLDRQGRHRGAEPRHAAVQQILVAGGRDGRRRHEARRDRLRRGGARRRRGGAARARDPAGRRRAAAAAEAETAADARALRASLAAPAAPRPSADGGRASERRRPELRLARRRADRLRARRRPEPGSGHRPRRPRDEEGHPRLHRVGRSPPQAPARTRPHRPQAPPSRGTSGSRRRRRPPAPPQPAPRRRPPVEAGVGEQVEPMTAMRRGIAEHMRRSLDTSAHVTSAIEVDMSRVVAIREKLKKEYQESYGVNPTYLIFVARAAIETLREYPWINGELRGDKIVTRNYVNLGFAVELADGKGLIVPVLKNAESLNLLGMASGVDRHRRARAEQEAPARRGPGRHVHDHEPGRLRHLPRHAGDQPAAGRDPRHLRARQAAVGHPGRARQGRDRDPADHEPHAHVRPPAGRRRARRPLPASTPRRSSRPGASRTTELRRSRSGARR